MMITRPQTASTSERMWVDKQNRVPLAQLSDQVSNLADLERVQAGRRLVQDQDLGVVQHRLRQADPLTESARKLADDPVLDLAKLTPADHLADRPAPVRSGNVLETRPMSQILDHPHLGIERNVFGKISDLAPDLERFVEYIVAGKRSTAAGGAQVGRQHPHCRRLAGPVGPEQTDDLATPDVEPDALDRLERAVSFRESVHLDHGIAHPAGKFRRRGHGPFISGYLTIMRRPPVVTGSDEQNGNNRLTMPVSHEYPVSSGSDSR